MANSCSTRYVFYTDPTDNRALLQLHKNIEGVLDEHRTCRFNEIAQKYALDSSISQRGTLLSIDDYSPDTSIS